jgi:hypothetical protein
MRSRGERGGIQDRARRFVRAGEMFHKAGDPDLACDPPRYRRGLCMPLQDVVQSGTSQLFERGIRVASLHERGNLRQDRNQARINPRVVAVRGTEGFLSAAEYAKLAANLKLKEDSDEDPVE